MTITPSNWTAVFKDAVDNTVYTSAGYESELTMDIKTGETFLFKALVDMSEKDIATQDMGCDVVPVRDTWVKAVINAVPFGITDYEVNRVDVSDATIQSAYEQAEINL